MCAGSDVSARVTNLVVAKHEPRLPARGVQKNYRTGMDMTKFTGCEDPRLL